MATENVTENNVVKSNCGILYLHKNFACLVELVDTSDLKSDLYIKVPVQVR